MEQLPSTAVGVLDMFATSRTGIDVFSDQIIESVKTGETNPLKVRVWIKTIEEILERVKKETAENQLTEASKYPENKFEFAGAIITKADRTTYDYSVCNDPVWNRRKAILDDAKEQLSQREFFLKTVSGYLTTVDEATGEEVQIHQPKKIVQSGLNVSIR